MERTKMSIQDYQETENILGKLRTINKDFLAVESIAFVLIYLVSIGNSLESELCENIMEFLNEHDTIMMAISVSIAVITILYYILLIKIPFHGVDFILVGIVGFVSLLYEGKTGSASNGNSLTPVVTGALISIALVFMFRKLYCDAMGKMTVDMSERVGRSWRGLWRLSRLTCIISALVIIVLKIYAQGLYDSLDRWSYDYGSTYTTFIIVTIVVAGATMALDLIMRAREIYCLKITQEEVRSKRNSMQSMDFSRPTGTTRQGDLMKQYGMRDDI